MNEVRVIPRDSQQCWCKHYNGTVNPACDAGIKYESVRVDHEPIQYRREGRHSINTVTRSLPCFQFENFADAKCDKCEFPTSEEIAAEKERREVLLAQTLIARAAIVVACGGPWKRGKPTASGSVACPRCGQKDSLRYSRAGVNGHIHASCTTKDCLAWME